MVLRAPEVPPLRDALAGRALPVGSVGRATGVT